jgi:uncharacterized integral membrane protein
MRFFYSIVFLILASAMGIFALENRETMTIEYFGQSVTCSRSLMIGVVYLLGIVSGWIIVGLVRRALRHAKESAPE